MLNRCPDFPRCRFCPYLAWSKEYQDFVCIHPYFAEFDREIKKGGSSNEEKRNGADHI